MTSAEMSAGAVACLLLTARQAASSCGKSLRTWRSWDAAGRIPRPVRIGRSTLWRFEEPRITLPPDPTEIARSIALLAPEGVVELRALGVPRHGVISGYYDEEHRKDLVEAAVRWSDQAHGVYCTLNSVDRSLLARSANRCQRNAKSTTGDSEVLQRRWLLVDCDPVRASGISSTDQQHAAALGRAREVRDWLGGEGWPAPVFADSGNGAHLLYRIDLPNDEDAKHQIQFVLDAIAARFSDSVVDIDRTTFNASRISKLYGTVARKGDAIPDRPHRLSRLLELPE